MIKVNNKKTRTTVLTCGVFERISHFFLKFLLLTLKKKISVGHIGFIWRLKDFENKYLYLSFHPLSANLTKWSHTLKQFVGNLPRNCLSVFDHFVGLALQGLKVKEILIISQDKPNWNTWHAFQYSLAFLFSSNIVEIV